MVQSTPLPIVTVTGISSSHYGYESLRNGVRLFPDTRIEISSADDVTDSTEDDDSDEDESEEDASDEKEVVSIPQRVDSCTATVYPPLNPDHETLTWPQNLVDQMKLEAKFSHDGITLIGSESTRHYEQVNLLASSMALTWQLQLFLSADPPSNPVQQSQASLLPDARFQTHLLGNEWAFR